MGLVIPEALSDEISANIDEGKVKFPGAVTWSWMLQEEVSGGDIIYVVAYRMTMNLTDNGIRMVAKIPLNVNPAHIYESTSFIWEEDVAITTGSSVNRFVRLPAPAIAVAAAMASFTEVLDYLADFIDNYAHV